MSKCLIANISKNLLDSFEYDYSYLKAEDLEVEMKDLIFESNKIESKLPISFSFVYLFDYEEEQMRMITNYFKERGINPICCAHTKSNLLWTLKELLEEIVKEHNTFSSMHTLQDLIKKLMRLPVKDNKEQIEKTLMQAFVILQEKNVDKMNEMITELSQIIRDHMKDA